MNFIQRTRIVVVGLGIQLCGFQTRVGYCAPRPSHSLPDAGLASANSGAGEPSETEVLESKANISWESSGTRENLRRGRVTIGSSIAGEELARWNIGGNSDANYLSSRSGFHPGTRVIVEIPSSGSAQIKNKQPPMIRQYLAALRNWGYWPYRVCFESWANNESRGGDTWIRVRATGRGRVTYAKMLKSTVEEAQISTCIVQATRSINLKRSFASGATFVMRIRVFPGDAPLAPAAIRGENHGTLDVVVYRDAVAAVKESIEHCIHSGLIRDRRLWGRLVLRLQVDGSGRVLGASEYGSHFPDGAVVSCSTSAVLEGKFPEPIRPSSFVLAVKVGSLPPLDTNSEGERRDITPTSQPIQ